MPSNQAFALNGDPGLLKAQQDGMCVSAEPCAKGLCVVADVCGAKGKLQQWTWLPGSFPNKKLQLLPTSGVSMATDNMCLDAGTVEQVSEAWV